MLKSRETFIVFTENNRIKNSMKAETFVQHTSVVSILRCALGEICLLNSAKKSNKGELV
jgi:hypothetical protein